MRMSRTVLLGVAAWLAVVAVGSTAVWFVISSAGENVGSAEDAPAQAAATVGAPRTHRPATTPPSTVQPSPTAPSPTAPPARRDTWQGLGGYVAAECRGRVIRFLAAQPDPGFSAEVGDKGPVTVEAHFAGHEDQSGRQSEVTAHCVGGVPRFESQSEGGGGGDE